MDHERLDKASERRGDKVEHINEPHPGDATEPAIDEFEQNMERIFRLDAVKPKTEYVNVYIYTGKMNDPAIYHLLTTHFIEIDELLGPLGERRSEYTGERMTTKNLGLTIPGRGESGWEKVIANNFLIIDKVLGELQAAGKKLEEDAQWEVACVFCGKRKGDHFGPETDPAPACYRGNPMGRRFMAVEATVMAITEATVAPKAVPPYTFGNGTLTIKGVSLTPAEKW